VKQGVNNVSNPWTPQWQ